MTTTLAHGTVTPADVDWARAQIETYRERYPNYETLASVLKEVLDHAVKELAPFAIVQSRPKSLASFGEKIWRKKHKYKNPVNRLTDLCGARVITHTAAQVEAVSEFIEQHFDIDWENTVDVSQRLKPTEFGYRSVHYIVKFRRGVFPSDRVGVRIPSTLLRMPNRRAEIQVRTVLEHAWADVWHDLIYKSDYRVPQRWIRETAGLAALLEGADSSVSRIQNSLATYRASYGDYMTPEGMREEIAKLTTVLAFDPGNTELAGRIGKLAITLGDWQEAIDVLCGVARTRHAGILRDLGVAVCKLHQEDSAGRKYRQGQRFLERACAEDPHDADALASLAGTWRGIDDDLAQDLYRRAYEVDPSNSYPLGNILEHQIADAGDASLVPLMGPVIATAIERCRDQADVGINLPWALYDIARFNLLFGKPYESLAAYSKALDLSTAAWMVETSERSLAGLGAAGRALPGFEWARRLLLVGRAAKFGDEEAKKELEALASSGAPTIAGPVVIIAGGCDPSVEEEMQGYRELLLEAFADFAGTVISGGTKEGISGLVGDVGARYRESIHIIGYVPGAGLPDDATSDEDRYSELRVTEGDGFSALEPLQNWIDLIACGILPADVKLIGINGGTIAAAEYRLALGIGAQVGLIEGSGREAAKLLPDEDWSTSPLLSRLPPDPAAVREFLGS